MRERIRAVVAGPGAEDADHGAETLARAMRDAGMEVVYTERRQTAEQLVATVVQEDADAIGLALPAGADAAPVGRLAGLLAERGVDDVVVFVLAAHAEEALPGAARVFARGTGPAEVVDWLRERLRG